MSEIKEIWEPEIEIIRYENADVIHTSAFLEDDELPHWVIQ